MMNCTKPTSNCRESTSEVARFLKDLPAFTFALWSQDGTTESGPNPASVVELLECFACDDEYQGPVPESNFREDMAKAIEGCAEIIKEVQEQIVKLRQSGHWYALLWHAHGDTTAHFEHSDDSPPWKEVAERFADDVCTRLIARTK